MIGVSVELVDQIKRFFDFGDRTIGISLILPSVKQNRNVSLTCENYPRFHEGMSTDDVLSALRVFHLLASVYDNGRIEILSHESTQKLTQDQRDSLGRHQVIIGGPPTNTFTASPDLTSGPIRFSDKGLGIDKRQVMVAGVEQPYEIEFVDGENGQKCISTDYCVVSKKRVRGRVIIVIAGLRAYGQWSSGTFLGTQDRVDSSLVEIEKFFEQIQSLHYIHDFQILVRVDVVRMALSGWQVIHALPWEPFDAFISYKKEDTEEVRNVVDELYKRGLSVFWAEADPVLPQGDGEGQLASYIKNSRRVLAFAGHGPPSNWQNRELSIAKAQGCEIALVRISDRDPLDAAYRFYQKAGAMDLCLDRNWNVTLAALAVWLLRR
jgi:hypothetical protein